MTGDEVFRRMDDARLRAGLTVQDLWLRYLALGGIGDAFDLDGYLQGVMPLDTFQRDVLAQSINEALDDLYRSLRVPLSSLPTDEEGGVPLVRLAEDLLRDPARARPSDPERPGADDG